MTDISSSTLESTTPSRLTRPTRRQALRRGLALAAAGLVLATGAAPVVLAQARPPQPAIVSPATDAAAQPSASSGLTPGQTEGPYFKPNSPERTSLVADGMQGALLTITGQVLSPDGQPVAGALLDFWQADASGQYDNAGYGLRGHQYTDENGSYTLTTVVPGEYPGRTEHIHVKVQAPGGPLLTTQLYFPGVAQNARDGIFDSHLLLDLHDTGDGTQSATFNFVVRTA